MIRKLFPGLPVAAVAFIFFGNSAFGEGGNVPSTPSPGTPTPSPVSSSWNINGGVYFAGNGQGMFEGGEGTINIQKLGFADSNLDMNVSGGLCAVSDTCQQGGFNFQGNAFEAVQVEGFVTGNTAGTPVMLLNAGQAQVGTSFIFERVAVPTAPAPAGK